VLFMPGLIGYFGASLIASAMAMLRQRRHNTPRILPHERGIVVVDGDQRTVYPAGRIDAVELGTRDLRLAGVKLGTFHELTLVVGEKRRRFSGFQRAGRPPFVDFARTLTARSLR
jgi:hypothetical protein